MMVIAVCKKSIFFKYLMLILIWNNGIFAIYEDQVGIFDWKQSLIGKVKFAEFDSHKRIIVVTEENVIASLNSKNGIINWRKVLEDPKLHHFKLLHVIDREALSISGDNTNFYIRGWDLSTGVLLYEWAIHFDKDMKSYFGVSENTLIHVAVLPNSHLELSKYQLKSGQNGGKSIKISAPWIQDLSQCVLIKNYWVCISDNKIKYINLMQEEKMYVRDLDLDFLGNLKVVALKHYVPSILIKNNENEGRIFQFTEEETLKKIEYKVSSKVSLSFNTIIYLSEIEKTLKFSSLDSGTGEEIIYPVDTGSEELELWDPEILSSVCKESACKILIQTVDNSLSVVQIPSGKISWSREEALSHIIASEFVELPVSLLDASIEHEFDVSSGGILTMFHKRITSQINQLMLLISGSQTTNNSTLLRDDFGLHKLIVLVTAVGKLFALDTLTGNIVWSKYLHDVEPFDVINGKRAILFLQRTSRHHPLPPQCVLFMKNTKTDDGIVYIFDPISGESREGIQHLPSSIKQAMLMSQENQQFLKPAIIILKDDSVKVIPENTYSDLYSHRNCLFMFNIDFKKNRLTGYSFRHVRESKKVTVSWNVDFGNSKVISFGVRPPSEIVHSQGRVLGDRSVLYKYINPNLIALATSTEDPLHRSVISVYLIDGVSGLIVYSACHKRARDPVHLVHSENWLVYTFFNERFRRTEAVAIELYEGPFQSNSSHFSSLAISQLPHVESQAYILPATPSALGVTLTERGITSKHLLVALTNGAVSQIPWMIMEPRGAFGPSGPEEGFVPYIPELPLIPEGYMNYNHSLPRVKGITMSPAKLESTCLVLVHGLDLFYTRVAPSKTFDLLKEDFDHGLIIMVLIGLTVACLVTKYLAARKAIRQMWK